MYERTLPAIAIHLDTKAPDFPSRVVIMPNFSFETNSTRSSTLRSMLGFSEFLEVYGSASLLPVFAFVNDIFGARVVN